MDAQPIPKGADDAIKAGAHLYLVEGRELESEVVSIEDHFGKREASRARGTAKPDKEEKESQLGTLLRLAADIPFARNDAGELYFTTPVRSADGGSHLESRPLHKLQDELRRRFREETGSVASAEALRSVSEQCRAENEESHGLPLVALRTQKDGTGIFIDLCDGLGSVVEITGGAWRVTRSSSARFVRHSGMLSLPTPEPGGNVDDLWRFLNLPSQSDRRLFLVWLLSAMLPTGPYPLAVLEGEQGAGKSTFARVLASFVDPSASDLRVTPKTDEDFAIQARHSHLLAYDNMAGIKRELSDLLCMASTGGTFTTRTRYSNTEETRHTLLRPVVLTGIAGLVGKPDLMDRVVRFELERIPDTSRMTEMKFSEAFEAESGKIYGALLDLLANALVVKGELKVERLSRMADFTLMGEAVGKTLGWGDGAFSEAYAEMRSALVTETMESNAVGASLIALMMEKAEWKGSWADLLSTLDDRTAERVKNRPGWPYDSVGIERSMRKSKTFLRESGIDYSTKPEGKQRKRIVTITNRNFVPPRLGDLDQDCFPGYDLGSENWV